MNAIDELAEQSILMEKILATTIKSRGKLKNLQMTLKTSKNL